MAMRALCLAAVAALATAAPLATRTALETDLRSLPEGWTRVGAADPTETLLLTLAVKQSNMHALQSRLLATSDPRNAAYGEHLSLDQVDEMVAPSPQATAAVSDFLGAHEGACERSASQDFVRCALNVSAAEQLLQTEFHTFEHASGYRSVQVHPERGYSLPASVAQHVDFVAPTVRFPTLRRPSRKGLKTGKPLRTNTPASLRSLYEVGDVEGNATGNKQACTAFLGQFYKPNDLKAFWKRYYPKASGRKIKLVGPDSGDAGVEASLDIQYISTMGGGVETEFWSFAGRAPGNPQNEPFLDWIYMVGNTSDSDVPKIFSTSYGEAESSVGMAYMNRINNEFVKTGSRGITLLFATGDNGVSDDNNRCEGARFAGQWPAASRWVTGVGGTEGGARLYNISEKAWDGSAGGFSDRWALPEFQKEAVSTYLSANKKKLPDAFHWNNSGSRAFPDVAAQATSFEVINDGMTEPVAGTSCATPTFSGILALLNDLRLQNGKPTLGYVNPFFYMNAGAFNDITQGSNSAGSNCGEKGFSAAKGWDPVTGLGTPSYVRLAAAVATLP